MQNDEKADLLELGKGRIETSLCDKVHHAHMPSPCAVKWDAAGKGHKFTVVIKAEGQEPLTASRELSDADLIASASATGYMKAKMEGRLDDVVTELGKVRDQRDEEQRAKAKRR